MTALAFANSDALQVGADKQRIGIQFYNPGSTLSFVSPMSSQAGSTGIPLIGQTWTPFFLTKDHGDLPAKAWRGRSQPGSTTIFVVQLYFTEAALTLSRDELMELGL